VFAHGDSTVRKPASDERATSPDYRGSVKSRTLALAVALRARAEDDADQARASRFRAAASKLEACATSGARRWGWRCGVAICPRCECRKAIRYRERLEDRLRRPYSIFKLVTATVATDDPWRGQAILRAAFGDLIRRRAWTAAVAGGEAHLQVKASRPGSARAFNIHFHAVVELRPGGVLDTVRLNDQWSLLLARRGAVGSLAVSGVERHWAVFRE
jgi:hypothetical protein